jgi:pyridoxamine 5'-phosphate oxidase
MGSKATAAGLWQTCQVRSEYHGQAEIPEGAEPSSILAEWIGEARDNGNPEPEAMCLATSGPSARMVLARGVSPEGIRFFTNYESRKAEQLLTDSRAAVCFWWPELARQVRAEGRAERLGPDESDAYFASRPRESRYGAVASPQSRRLPSREWLEERLAELRAQHPDGPPRPDWWGGYRLVPDRWEFWIGRPSRLHVRHEFLRSGAGWERRLLAP